MLRTRGHQVDVVANGREAVDAVAARRYDLVLMDIQMPEMDGFEATARIRALPQGGKLPIIALTAHALSGERERCLERGMTGYLAKPFKAHELFAVVEGRGPDGVEPGPTASPPVDVEPFRRTMEEAGAAEAVDGILATFVQTLPQRLEALTAATGGDSAEPIQRAAHAFKSAAATIGARALATLLEQIEAAARDGDVAGARDKLESVRTEASAALAYLPTTGKGGRGRRRGVELPAGRARQGRGLRGEDRHQRPRGVGAAAAGAHPDRDLRLVHAGDGRRGAMPPHPRAHPRAVCLLHPGHRPRGQA